MEDADPDAREKAAVLADEFHDHFADFLVTFHPYGLPGEVREKVRGFNAQRIFRM